MNKLFRFYFIGFFTIISILSLNSCIEPDDLMTENVKTGGLVDATSALQFKPSSTQSVDIQIIIYKGPRVESIKVYKKFTHFISEAGSVSVAESKQILLKTISVGDSNLTDTLLLEDSFTWTELSLGIPQLPGGYNVPTDPTNAQVGDYYTLTYVSVLSDGREVTNMAQTQIVVANFFAGYYVSYLRYFHPTLGGTYPNNPYYEDYFLKELFTVSSSDCATFFALWSDATMDIFVNTDNTVSFSVENFNYIVNEGDPYDLTKKSYYDPISKTIYLYYYYEASGGYRVFWEELSPYVE